MENAVAIRHLLYVALNGVEPPPNRVAAVEPSIFATVKQVRDQAVTQAGRVSQQVVSGLLVASGENEQTPKGNKSISSPIAHVASGEVRKTCRKIFLLQTTISTSHEDALTSRKRKEHLFSDSIEQPCSRQWRRKRWR